VYPELGRLAAIDPAAAADQGHSVGQQGTTRTKSEEEEYHHQQSVQLMHREQIQNEILLDTVKRIQGSTVGSLYENEIELLRTVIEQKQGFINKLHAEGLELLQKIEDYQLRLGDEEDRSREERERVLRETEAVEAAIDAISQDKQLAVQRLRQYEMLYKRTIEDKNDAESTMSRARELVSMGREDLRALGECLLQTKAMQEKHDRELSATMTRLESSRSTWRSSLEQRTREIDSIIRQYEEAKSSRIREEGAAARQRLEAERVRREMEVRERERASHQAREAERTNSVQVDRWRVVCAAAGLGEGSSAEAVIAAYEACKRLHPQGEDGHFDALEPARLAPPVQPVEATEANRSSPSGTPSLAPVRPCAMPSIRAEMSIRMIRQKLASHTGQDEAADDDALVEQLRMLLSDPASITDLADLTKEEDRTLGDAWDKATSAVKSTHVTRVGPLKRSPSASSSAPPSASSSRAPPPLTTAKASGSDTDRDVELQSRILSRQEIKARSRKTHARLNKVGRVC
jgi:hypothetical protein